MYELNNYCKIKVKNFITCHSLYLHNLSYKFPYNLKDVSLFTYYHYSN